MSELIEYLEERRRSELINACEGLLYLVKAGYLAKQACFVGPSNELVHTVMFPAKGRREGFLLNHCPICGSAFTKPEGDRPSTPNCAEQK